MMKKPHVLTTGTYVVTIAGGGTGRSAANQSGGLAGNSTFNPSSPAAIDGSQEIFWLR